MIYNAYYSPDIYICSMCIIKNLLILPFKVGEGYVLEKEGL